MKKIIISLSLTLFCFISFFSIYNYKETSFAISSSSEIVMEVNSKRVLYEKDANSRRYMASTTKILTAIVVIENFDIEKKVVIKKEYVGIEGSSLYLEEGEELSIKELLYGLMLRSGNDCAQALAIECCGNVKEIAKLMNATAKKIGAKNSNFVNPHGLHDDNHFTTAYDLALISSYAIKNSIFKEIVSTKKITIPCTTKDYSRVLINKNKMLTKFNGANGIKTGYTKRAGRCLVTSCNRNGMELVCVVLNCPQMWEVSASLLESSYSNYSMVKVVDKNNLLGFANDAEKNKIGLYVTNNVILPLTIYEAKNIDLQIKLHKNLPSLVKKDTYIGKVYIFAQNNLLFEEKIYNIIDIKSKVYYENK